MLKRSLAMLSGIWAHDESHRANCSQLNSLANQISSKFCDQKVQKFFQKSFSKKKKFFKSFLSLVSSSLASNFLSFTLFNEKFSIKSFKLKVFHQKNSQRKCENSRSDFKNFESKSKKENLLKECQSESDAWATRIHSVLPEIKAVSQVNPSPRASQTHSQTKQFKSFFPRTVRRQASKPQAAVGFLWESISEELPHVKRLSVVRSHEQPFTGYRYSLLA